MTSTYSTNKAIEEPANGDYVNTWSTPVNSNFNIIDKAFGGHLIINATGVSGTTALTTTQYQNLYILFSGTLSANVNYQVPSGVGGQWVVYNGTSGTFTLTLSSGGGGSSVTITQGTRTLIVSDGTNVTLSVNTVTSPGGADTSIQFNQSGVFGGSSNLAWNYGTNTLGVTGAANISGNVGIGTSSPTTKLTVSGSGFNGGSGTFISTTSGNSVVVNGINAAGVYDSAYIYLTDGTNTAYAGLTAQNASGTVGSLRFGVAGTEYARIQPNGNVGIGTTTPGSKLTVVANTNSNDGLSVSNTSTGASAQAFLGVVAQGWTGVQIVQNQASGSVLFYSADNVPMIFDTNAGERMRITAAGNVGIGTSNPDSFYGNAVPLAVVKNQNAATIFGIANSTVGTSAATQINIIGGTGYSYLYQELVDNNGSPYFTNEFGSAVNYAKWGFGGTERMRITAAGNVGIGTSNPTVALDVVGNISRLSYSAGYLNYVLNNTSSGQYKSGIIFQNSGTSKWELGVDLGSAGTQNFFIYDNVAAASRFYINSSGNVGIGTLSPSYLLDVNGTGRFTGAVTTAALTASSLSLSTALSAANGGTGLTSAGTSGNVLTSNGSAWVSSAPASSVPNPSAIGQVPFSNDGSTWTATQKITQGTLTSPTSGTSVSFAGIPSWAKRVTIMFSSLAMSGSGRLIIQLGTSGGLVSTGYNAVSSDVGGSNQSAGVTNTTGFICGYAISGTSDSGSVVMTLMGSNIWTSTGNLTRNTTNFMQVSAGSISLGGVLTQIAITSTNGTDTFSSGSINIMYE